MEFTIKRKYILGLGNWLQSLSLQGQDSRNRTKFVEMLAEEVKENEETRMEIVKKYAKLDDKNEPVLVEKEGGAKHYEIPDDKMEEFQKEVVSFLEQDATFGGAGMKNRFETVKNIVLNTTEKIGPQIAADYDVWCEAFEAIKTDNQ